MKHIFVDFETSGNQIQGKILNVAFTWFSLDSIESIEDIVSRCKFFKFNFNLEEQAKYIHDKETLNWWKKLPKEVFMEAFANPENGIDFNTFVDEFDDYVSSHMKNGHIWSRGAFDINLLERIYTDIGRKSLVGFWRQRDARSFIDAANILLGLDDPFIGKVKDFKQSYVAHDPKHDIAKDIQQLQLVYTTLQELQ
jgi:hypothetical protein